MNTKYCDGFLTVEKTGDNYFFCYDKTYGYLPSVIGEYLIKNLKESLKQGYYILDLITRLELYSVK